MLYHYLKSNPRQSHWWGRELAQYGRDGRASTMSLTWTTSTLGWRVSSKSEASITLIPPPRLLLCQSSYLSTLHFQKPLTLDWFPPHSAAEYGLVYQVASASRYLLIGKLCKIMKSLESITVFNVLQYNYLYTDLLIVHIDWVLPHFQNYMFFEMSWSEIRPSIASPLKRHLTVGAEGAKTSAEQSLHCNHLLEKKPVRRKNHNSREVIAADAYLTFIAIIHQVYIRQYVSSFVFDTHLIRAPRIQS